MVNEQFSPSYLDLMNLHTSPDVVQADTYNPVIQMGESSECFNPPQQNIGFGFRSFSYDTNAWSRGGGSSTRNQTEMVQNYGPSNDDDSSWLSIFHGENLFGSNANNERRCGCTADYLRSNPQNLRHSSRNPHK
ncbi:hypothetical protein M5689_006498 [Euphorbia peplus]|nr:hypothetical protein M5689_006498 [Euphorbia peplus]